MTVKLTIEVHLDGEPDDQDEAEVIRWIRQACEPFQVDVYRHDDQGSLHYTLLS